MRKRTILMLNLIGALALTGVLLAQSAPFVGTWKLNLTKSKYDPPPPPKSSTVKIEASEGGFQQTTDTVTGKGETQHIVVTAKFDGKDIAVKGNPDVDTSAYKRLDDRSYEVVSKKGGKVTTTAKVVYAADGKSRTATVTGKNPQGQTVNNSVFYDRQ